MPLNPLRSLWRLLAGDFIAKAFNFLTFIYLARILGVEPYGVLEFANAFLTYGLLLTDGGIDVWATREVARGTAIQPLVARIVPLRLLLAGIVLSVLLLALPILPTYPGLRTVIVLFGVTLFVQAVNLKWVYMGQERMAAVARGLIIAQSVFAGGIVLCVHGPERLVWVPLLWIAGDVVMAGYFWRLFLRQYGGSLEAFTLQDTWSILRPALTLGLAYGLSLLSYNFDAVLMGFFLGPLAVGLYTAAYKPVTVSLAVPITYFRGLFPILSRTYADNRAAFRDLVVHSLQLAAIIALPVGVGGFFLAAPLMALLFGPSYAHAVPALQILVWSATLVILRSTYRRALQAANQAHVDLRCAGIATTLNILFNLFLVPRYGILGAAAATVGADILWLILIAYSFSRYVLPMHLFSLLTAPVIAAGVMGGCFLLLQSFFWGLQASLALLVYVGIVLLIGGPVVRVWRPLHTAQV